MTTTKDELIAFPQLKGKKQHILFRLITAVTKKDNQTLQFITSLIDINAVVDITELYRYRWSIEIFFRFLQQKLYLESLLSYSENGMKVHIYVDFDRFLVSLDLQGTKQY